MNDYTHIILDEVHERDSEMDFLLIVVRKLVNTVSRQVKVCIRRILLGEEEVNSLKTLISFQVILMSATIETHIFSEYFFTMWSGKKIYPVVAEVSKNENFPVKEFYLNEIGRNLPQVSESK